MYETKANSARAHRHTHTDTRTRTHVYTNTIRTPAMAQRGIMIIHFYATKLFSANSMTLLLLRRLLSLPLLRRRQKIVDSERKKKNRIVIDSNTSGMCDKTSVIITRLSYMEIYKKKKKNQSRANYNQTIINTFRPIDCLLIVFY